MLIVFGSINMDMAVTLPHMPEAGETVLCPNCEMSPGGKGANQAMAALRAGAKVALVGKVGDDVPGSRLVTGLRREGIIMSGVGISTQSTGCAFILRETDGGNRIIVAGGANLDAHEDQVPLEILGKNSMLLLQMEVPHEHNWTLLARAKSGGATTVLNCAPAAAIPADALNNIDVLILNEIEITQLCDSINIKGLKDILQMAQELSRLGNLTCVVTLGDKGAIAWTRENKPVHVPALPIENVVDTTGAGDAFCGTLAACLQEKRTLEESMRRAVVAGSLACTKKGAQSSFAWLGEIEENLQRLP